MTSALSAAKVAKLNKSNRAMKDAWEPFQLAPQPPFFLIFLVAP